MIGRAIGLLVLCFLVGLMLATLGVTAQGMLSDTWNTIRGVFQLLEYMSAWALPYILLGAVVVVPLTLLGLLRRLGSGRR